MPVWLHPDSLGPRLLLGILEMRGGVLCRLRERVQSKEEEWCGLRVALARSPRREFRGKIVLRKGQAHRDRAAKSVENLVPTVHFPRTSRPGQRYARPCHRSSNIHHPSNWSPVKVLLAFLFFLLPQSSFFFLLLSSPCPLPLN